MAKKLTFFCIRSIVSGVFGAAACFKLSDPTTTHLAVYQYKLLSWEIAQSVAAFLPWLEMAAAFGLWIPRLRLGAATLCSILSIVFLGALSSAVIRKIDISCGCFGAVDAAITLGPRIVQDIALLALSALLIKEAAPRNREQLLFASQADK
jgi:putative oxidoreductase